MKKMIRTTISLPEPLLKAAREVAAQHGVTLSALVEDALRGYLAQPALVSARNPFALVRVAGRLVDPNIDLDRTSTLLTLDDEEQFQSRRT
jgi:hypothetical protein